MQENIRSQAIAGLIIIVLLIGVGYYVYRSMGEGEVAPNDTSVATSTPEGGNENEEGSSSEITDLIVPDLNRAYAAPARLPESIRKESESKYTAAIALLKEDSGKWDAWMEIAVYRKGSDDFKGAEEVWLYVTERWPADPVAYANLADMYANYLNDYERAEAYYFQVLSLKSDSVATYLNLHNLYRLKYKVEGNNAANILLDGMKQVPENVDLPFALGVYYKQKGDGVLAEKYLTIARNLSEKTGNSARTESIQEEVNSL